MGVISGQEAYGRYVIVQMDNGGLPMNLDEVKAFGDSPFGRFTPQGISDCSTTGGNADGRECKFPFIYKGVTYNTCTSVDNNNQPWCYTDGRTNCRTTLVREIGCGATVPPLAKVGAPSLKNL